MRCAIRTLVVFLAAMLPAASIAETLELRIFRVDTGLDPGDGSGRPASDYYIDGGKADGLAAGMKLSAHRALRIDDPVRNGAHHVLLPVGELEVLRVYEDSSVTRVSSIERPDEAAVFQPRAMMIGDYVFYAPPEDPGEVSQGGQGPAMPAGDQEGSRATPRSSVTAPEAFVPGFPSSNEWFPLPPPVLFDLNSSNLDPAAQLDLEGVALVLTDNPHRLIALEGRTCDLGTPSYNQALSLRRARTVAAFLQSRGVVADRVSVTGFGEDSPVAPNTAESGRRSNRRVDLHLGAQVPTLEPEIPRN